MKKNFLAHITRRTNLLAALADSYPQYKKGALVLFAAFERGSRIPFRQESSFYYLTGIEEPGAALIMDLQGKTELYIPNCAAERAKWVTSTTELTEKNAINLGLSSIKTLGNAVPGYAFNPFFPREQYQTLLDKLAEIVRDGGVIFTLSPDNSHEYAEQRFHLERLKAFVPEIAGKIVDIAPLVAAMRRKKDTHEIERLYKAVEITMLAQEAAAGAIEDGVLECEVQANLEYMMTGSAARPSFTSIVAGGKNSTVLHYVQNSDVLRNGGLVIVDIGAESDYYAADLTRTYPISGKFTQRQRQIYNLVLDTQEYIAGIAKPGMWLNNKEQPEKSLNHLAKKYLTERGYGDYFIHNIGHYLGLDVHDVGDYSVPLQEGDVITIEPGIYIPKENIGVRIEDDYWIVRDGVICLSEPLPKTAEEIEQFMKEGLAEDNGLTGKDFNDLEEDDEDGDDDYDA